jgi:hypothetical protein
LFIDDAQPGYGVMPQVFDDSVSNAIDEGDEDVMLRMLVTI